MCEEFVYLNLQCWCSIFGRAQNLLGLVAGDGDIVKSPTSFDLKTPRFAPSNAKDGLRSVARCSQVGSRTEAHAVKLLALDAVR
jgi:hypothetical protein